MLFSILSLEAFYFFEKINFLLQKVGTGEWGQGWSDKIFMYCVFHHISDHLQRLILFWPILQKKKLELSQQFETNKLAGKLVFHNNKELPNWRRRKRP